MGLLDDAIKDHIELKRRHGADPGEIARLEHEALGPARREPTAAVADEPLVADTDDAYDDEVPADERLEPPSRYAQPEPKPEPPEPETAAGELRVPEFEPAPRDEEPRHEPEPEPEPEPGPEPEAAAPRDEPEAVVDQPTRQFSLEELEDASSPPRAPKQEAPEPEDEGPAAAPRADVVPADDEPDGDDVLEETPEFLQETPEHDRLWFEQKPPKDFDF
jgi:hypothetical protein